MVYSDVYTSKQLTVYNSNLTCSKPLLNGSHYIALAKTNFRFCHCKVIHVVLFLAVYARVPRQTNNQNNSICLVVAYQIDFYN